MKHLTAAISALLIVMALAAIAVALHLSPSEFTFFALPRDAVAFAAHQANERKAWMLTALGIVLFGGGCFMAVRHAVRLHRGR